MSTSKIVVPTGPAQAPDRGRASPLLPLFFVQPSVFLWLWVLPLGILFLLNLQGYRLVEGNMNETQRSSALLFGGCNLALVLASLGCYAGSRWLLRHRAGHEILHPAWSLGVIAVHAAYLWLAVATVDSILPASVTAWLYPETQFIFNQFAFAMLPLFWAILRLAGTPSSPNFRRSFSVSLGLAIGTPVALYLLFNVARLTGFPSVAPFLVASGIVLAGLVMFVGLSRALLLALQNARNWGATGERLAILFCALILPLGGLVLNRTIPFPVDFQAWEVYALVVANFGTLLLASFQRAAWPRASLYLLSTTLPFSLYFFIVFLPYTPLSILAVIVMGAGFLVLTPILLFILHLYLFHQARLRLPAPFRAGRVTASCTLCFLFLPAFFTLRGLADKVALNAALDYVYAPAIETGHNEYRSSRLNLRRALDNHRAYKNGIFYPLLSPFYSWLVFDNLILPDDKLAILEKTFFGEAGGIQNLDPVRNRSFWGPDSSVRERSRMPRGRPVPRTVELQSLQATVKPADQSSATLTLTFTLQNTGAAAAEYARSLPLPAGVYVSGFRLHVDGKPVPGRITEKKTALWVYTMIRDSERRDPGLLFFNGPNALELRVFPVGREKPSIVEIDFLVPVPNTMLAAITGDSDPAELLLRAGALSRTILTPTSRGLALLTAGSLPAVPRDTYLHIIVDRSDRFGFTGEVADALAVLRKKFPEAKQARVTLANYDVVAVTDSLVPWDRLPALDQATIDHLLPRSGGFDVDRALAGAIRQHRAGELDHPPASAIPPPRPIFVVLSNRPELMPAQFELAGEWSDLLPRLEIYQLTPQGIAPLPVGPGAAETPLVRLGGSIRAISSSSLADFPEATGRDHPEYFDPAHRQWRALDTVTLSSVSGPWAQAVDLQLKQRQLSRSPGDSDQTLKTLVAASRETGIMIPSTSYIVVENQAQWRMLDLSERRKLDQNNALSFRETPAPSALWIALGFGGWLLLRRYRPRRLGAVAQS